MSRNSQLEVENKRLSMEVAEMKEICARTSSMSVKYKMQLDGEKQTKEELLEGNAKLKKKVNELASRCHEQNEKIRVLENNLRRSASASMRNSRVTFIENVSQIIQKTDPKTTREYIDLEQKYDELEKEYQEALSIIDELEFELEDVSEHKKHKKLAVISLLWVERGFNVL
jgi:chromosome segregation ATPase